ncbi:MAG: ATP-binding protein, partial [Actinomycetota bacterium]
GIPEPIDVNQVVRDMHRMFARAIRENITIDVDLGHDLPKILADHGRLEQVLMNLVVNAADAIPGNGTISISTHAIDVSGHLNSSLGLQPGPHAALRIEDTGIGMTADVKQRLFEPFFTTKDPGKGTGLGLATVYSIVNALGGRIQVDSTQGEGSTFTIFLPASSSEPESGKGLEGEPSLAPDKHTVLVVEDEEAVADIVCRILQRKGYVVLRASSGPEAIRISEGHDVHLLITDVVMPIMSGKELAEVLQLPTLFMSGYPDQNFSLEELGREGTTFLQKPFTQLELLQKVAEVLNESSSRQSSGDLSG